MEQLGDVRRQLVQLYLQAVDLASQSGERLLVREEETCQRVSVLLNGCLFVCVNEDYAGL